MASTRIKKIGGIYQTADFIKIVRQLNGRAVLVVAIINSHCDECAKMLKFVQQLESGFIDRLPQMVMIYGFSSHALPDKSDDISKKPSPVDKEKSNKGNNKEKKQLGDSRYLVWEGLPYHHGYAIFLSNEDILYYSHVFDHDEIVTNIVDSIRRFKSSIKTIEGLTGKRKFMKNKRSGIIVETNSSTSQSQIMKIEDRVKAYAGKLPMAVFFCKGISQEITLVKGGEVIMRKKGLQLDKFLKKIVSSKN